jgi:hypothetical protein
MTERTLEQRVADLEAVVSALLGGADERTPGQAAEEAHESLVAKRRAMREGE